MSRRDEAAASSRLFFGLPVASTLRVPLRELAVRLADVAGGRPVDGANLHATVAFLGNVAPHRHDALRDIGGRLPTTSFAIALDTVGSFEGAHVGWIGPSAIPPPLAALHRTLARLLAAEGFPVEARTYHPHVTLIRRCGALPTHGVPPLAWAADCVCLYESMSAPGGVRYVVRARWPLRA